MISLHINLFCAVHHYYLCTLIVKCYRFRCNIHQELIKLELFTLRVSWLLYLALMRGV